MEPHKIVSEVLTTVAGFAEVGVDLYTLDKIAEQAIHSRGAKSYNKGYHPKWAKTPFPSNICLNTNNTIAHGIADNYILKNGDILSIDCGIVVDGKCGDAALTIPIGNISEMNLRLLKYSKNALYQGIKAVKAGNSVLDIGRAIDAYITKMGYVSNKNLTGHGIGTAMHEDPVVFGFDVSPYLEPDEKIKFDVPLKAGQIICIEPMITYKDDRGIKDRNDWTWRTRDGRNSAIFEHMVLVTETGYEVLTTHITNDDNHKINSKTIAKRAD